MLKKHLAILCLTLFILTGSQDIAAQCPNKFVKAMQQEGLEADRIVRICEHLARLSEFERPEITTDKIEKDIVGKWVPGWIFQEHEWREIDIVSSEYSAEKAKVEIKVDTIRNKYGTLRLHYLWTGSRWKLVRVINIDFE